MNVKIMEPYGFCVGVEKVIELINKIIQRHQDVSIFCVGQIVHNKDVNDELIEKGIILLSGDKNEIIDSINEGVVVFSAHGTDEKIVNKAKEKGLIVYNAICPFVQKEFTIIKNKIKEGYDVIYIGINKHEETIAALSISSKIHFVENKNDIKNLIIDNNKIVAINQTTLSIIDLKEVFNNLKNKYPNIEIIDEICGSTRMRQSILLNKDDSVDGVVVVGDENSNNTKSLKTTALKTGYNVIMVDNHKNLDLEWFDDKNNIIIVSGASTMKKNVEEVYQKLKKLK